MKILVTGATGFLGRQICAHLRASGYQVIGASRRVDAPRLLLGIRTARILDNITDIEGYVAECDAVIHLMARTHRNDTNDPDAERLYRRANVDSTLAMLNMCAQGGVKKFIYMSSIKAVGEGAGSPYTETSEPHPEDFYGKTKLEAEKLVLSCSGLQTVIIRIPMAYGPEVRGNFHALMGAVERGIPLPLDGLQNSRSLIYSGNLSDAVRALIASDSVSGVYNVANRETLSTSELVRSMGTSLGVPARMIRIPQWLLRAIGRITGRSEAIRKLTGSLVVSIDRIRTDTGWTPPFSHAQGMQSTAAWFKNRRGK